MSHSNITSRLVIAALLAALGACSTAPPSAGVNSAAVEARADSARAAGDLTTAAALYRQIAATSRGTLRAGYLIEAAGLWVQVSDYSSAALALADARESATSTQLMTVEILAARIDVGSGRPAEGLARLDAAGPVSEPELASVAAEARGLALFELGRPTEAVTVLVEREFWLNTAADVLANQRLIWDGLSRLAVVPPPSADEIVTGWLALAPLTSLEGDPVAFRRALIDWRARYATHPAAGGVLAEIVADHRGALDFPQRIAVLLPLGSTRRVQAQAIRDGFLAARIADARASDTTITLYDTASRGSVDAYIAAQSDGADFIVGPLLPDEVEQIVPQTGFVPTLTLNFSQSTNMIFPASLYQYALAPEDEARAIATRAIAEGQHTAIALYASSDRGYRLMASFREAFEAQGGEILAAAAYVPESQNAAGPIADILNVARSEQRHRRLQANLGRPVEFESRRRQDVDMIFLQASASLGRLLAPQLRFHQAGDIPTYATSDIFDTARTARESDLNGIIFPDLPILLTPSAEATEFASQLRQFWPEQARQWIRFYSFGFDAYRLIRPIFNPTPGDWPVAGVTGMLELAGDGRVHRGLPFAQFQNGMPNAIAAAPTVVLTMTDTAPNNASSESLGIR